MTEYGRGPGSEPWHPEDPLYGDQGWGGRQADHGQGQYGDQQQSYPQDPYAQQHHHQQHHHQQHQQYPQQQHQQYDAQQQYEQPHQHQQQYGAQQQDPYGQQPPAQPQYDGGWDSGQRAAVPYGAEPQDPYAQQQPGYGESHDYYGTPEAYPPPQPPGRREAPEQQQKPSTDWDPDQPQEETHPFFTGADEPAAREPRDDDDDPDDDSSRSSRRDRGGSERRGGKGKKKKSRNGCACLVVSLVLVGGLGGVSYVGYTYWKKQFGAPADFAGSGTDEQVEVEIPEGSYGYDIANILRKKGVIKSSDAFVAAQNDNPKGKSLQAGVYLLNKEMSAASAIELMLDTKSQNLLVIPEGTRNSTIYANIDKRLELEKGTTAKIAKTKAESLGLPDWADDNPDVKDPLEGFLYPAAYPVAKGSKPEDALKRMVTRANKEYGKLGLEGSAKKLGLENPWQLVTVASLVQVEGKYKHDFDKVSRVVYNRLKPGNMETVGRLEFDSTINYIKGQSTLDVGAVDTLRQIDDPYNTYRIVGLPAGPISNPGADALHSALNPTPGPWYYFVSINEDKTIFSVTNDEHNRNRAKYEAERKKSGQ
ncbi:endolytic transglycosylase MltG [Streptomyces sp. ISL-111]|uniref:endolytic transglycosylase MltG n=1 Tax=Streptomyces sp. ISL-111 TaxID=2819175 RepID=UPI001BE5FBA8|nr:endolytic transglycosylase MltG [Streptomyces sp. ISL-111]MBT2379429.1 endolytic transglycosylase MltG [Streptomyces sp. ISL-111]